MRYNIQNNFFQEMERVIQQNKISHAYLIETNGISNIDQVINILAKMLLCPKKKCQFNCEDCNVCNLIDLNFYPDLKIIDNDGGLIKKEQLVDVKKKFVDKSIYNNKQIYIIKDASKLNSSSGNTMLKFLEEPSPNIIAILLVENRYSVMETILSRCQIFSLYNDEVIQFDDNVYTLMKSLFLKDKGFLCYNNILSIIPDKISAKKNLSLIENYLFMVINSKIDLINDLNNLNSNIIYKLILIIEKYLSKLEYNLNYKLVLDNLIIEINEVIS